MMRRALRALRAALRPRSANLPWDPLSPARRAQLHRDKARRVERFRAALRASALRAAA